ncbi:MAG: Hg(II)-responsive transcriptional regulator [Thiohalomonadales bacterium]
MSQTSLTIGKLAKQAQVNVETIRYYQRVGLIKEPEKPNKGFRVYSIDDVSRIRFIKRAQELGFTLKEIEDLLDLGDGNCAQVQILAEQKLLQINARLNDLQAMKHAVTDLLEQCKVSEKDIHCVLINSLSDN